MSLAIDVDRVGAVLLADGWHRVVKDSFAMDAYEFVWRPNPVAYPDDEILVHGGGANGICAKGFSFEEAGGFVISGPLTSILAVKQETEERIAAMAADHQGER